MFTITLTKFHHYVFPVVPPTGDADGSAARPCIGRSRAAEAAAACCCTEGGWTASATLLVYGAFRLFPGSLLGSTIEKSPPPAVLWIGVLSLLLGTAAAFATVRFLAPRSAAGSASDKSEAAAAPVVAGADPYRDRAVSPDSAATDSTPYNYDRVLLGALGIASAVVVALAGRDMVSTQPGDVQGQARLMQLFTYNYRRPWPQSLDFNAILLGFHYCQRGPFAHCWYFIACAPT